MAHPNSHTGEFLKANDAAAQEADAICQTRRASTATQLSFKKTNMTGQTLGSVVRVLCVWMILERFTVGYCILAGVRLCACWSNQSCVVLVARIITQALHVQTRIKFTCQHSSASRFKKGVGEWRVCGGTMCTCMCGVVWIVGEGRHEERATRSCASDNVSDWHFGRVNSYMLEFNARHGAIEHTVNNVCLKC